MTFARAAAFIVLSYVALLVLSAICALLPPALRGPVPQITLLVVLHLGLRGPGAASGYLGVALVIGYLTDLLAGSPLGLHALGFGVVVVAARGMQSRLMVANVWQQVVVTLLVGLGHGALTVALAAPMYLGEALPALRLVPASALLTALFGPLLFALFRRIDRRLSPDPRALRMGV